MGGAPEDEPWRDNGVMTHQHLLVKRDDAIPFAFGGNKVRKLSYVIAEALAEGADTIITCGGPFDYANGVYLERTVVRAHRVDTPVAA